MADFFRGRQINSISLPAIDHVISVTHSEDSTVHFRIFNIHFKNSGTKIPKVELSPMGPFADLKLRRTRWASSDMAKAARKVPKELKPAKQKNVSHDVFGEKVGRIHMERQNFDKLQTRKMKGLKRRREENIDEDEPSEMDGEVAQNSGAESSD
jgi:ribosome production factor 2